MYGRTKARVEDTLQADGVTDPATLETRGREAGRAATIRAVRDLTGVPIDRFAEVGLVGFYDLATALGGVQVCLNHAVSDDYSGADFRAGVQTLSASRSLAFVRQRHGLTNGDLDRTHRQQAFLLSALHQVTTAGTLTDLGKLTRLLGVIDDDVVLSAGWDVVSWGRDLASTPDQKIAFRTLPVVRYATVDGQDVNIIDPAAIRAQVQAAFGVRSSAPRVAGPGATTPRTDASSAVGGVVDSGSPGAGSPDAGSTDAGSTDTGGTDPGGPPPDNGGPVINAGDGVPCVD